MNPAPHSADQARSGSGLKWAGVPTWAQGWGALWPLIPALLAVLVYLPALHGEFVYDDSMIISENLLSVVTR